MKFKYKIKIGGGQQILLSVYMYTEIYDISILPPSYLLVFNKIGNTYICNDPNIVASMQNWLVENGIIKIEKKPIIMLTSKSLLQIL